MLKLYTCYKCAFPFKADDKNLPPECPACGASPDNFLGEPYNKEEKRRIHVDPPVTDPNWDPMNSEFHVAKKFPLKTRNGRLRRFVLEYDDLDKIVEYYKDVFDWDIIDSVDDTNKSSIKYCATGPGNPNWEPRVVSFIYGYLKKREKQDYKNPMFVIEVDSIEETLKLAKKFGGKLLKSKFVFSGVEMAIIEDSEGNSLYLWETPATVTWDEPESQSDL